MKKRKNNVAKADSQFHERNKYQGRYDFDQLVAVCPELGKHVHVNKFGNQSIDFFNPESVKLLNKALLIDFYALEYWGVPNGYLCPPLPSRSDYVHHIADVLSRYNNGKMPRGKKVLGLDVGIGANCIYPVIGTCEYGWSFVGSELDEVAISSASKIISSNKILNGKIEIRKQNEANHIFQNVIGENEYFDFTICNPPFHASAEDANREAARKAQNLKGGKSKKIELNFGGQNNELWTKGGELEFIESMIHESKLFANSVFLFSTLVSKKENVEKINDALKKVEVKQVRTIKLNHGNKMSRIVFWTFLNEKQREAWVKFRWK